MASIAPLSCWDVMHGHSVDFNFRIRIGPSIAASSMQVLGVAVVVLLLCCGENDFCF